MTNTPNGADIPTEQSLGGWFTDPYRRHEARWMSQGRPTSLVRDGTIEGNDPVADEPFKVTPVRIANGPFLDETSGQTPFDGSGSFFRSRRDGTLNYRRIAAGIAIVGLGAFVLGWQLGATPAHAVYHFTPTPRQANPAAAQAARSPSGCPSNLPNEAATYSLDSSSGDIALTAYQGNEIDVYTDDLSISPHSPLCVLQSETSGISYQAFTTGTTFIYIFRGDKISVIRIQVLPPYDTAPWGTITFMGLLLFAFGLVGFGVSSYNSRKRPFESLRRADDAQCEGSYDPEAAAESAFRVFGENQRW